MSCTIKFMDGNDDHEFLVEDDYEEVSGRLHQVSNEASPVIKVTYEGEQVTIAAHNIVVFPGER